VRVGFGGCDGGELQNRECGSIPDFGLRHKYDYWLTGLGNIGTLELHYVSGCHLKLCCVASYNMLYMTYLFQLDFLIGVETYFVEVSVFTVSYLVQNG
jgi:hypothetical protein